jgi:hypothetical protein
MSFLSSEAQATRLRQRSGERAWRQLAPPRSFFGSSRAPLLLAGVGSRSACQQEVPRGTNAIGAYIGACKRSPEESRSAREWLARPELRHVAHDDQKQLNLPGNVNVLLTECSKPQQDECSW